MIFIFIKEIRDRKKIRQQIISLANNTLEISPEEFFNIRNKRVGRKLYSNQYNFPGIYILYNTQKNMYYIGQGKKVFDRVNSHFTGKGNGDVYADYKYGAPFKIKMISLSNSGFNSLNELEKNAIMTYDSYSNGYNKTRGNKR